MDNVGLIEEDTPPLAMANDKDYKDEDKDK
jgi:hypothetical protein